MTLYHVAPQTARLGITLAGLDWRNGRAYAESWRASYGATLTERPGRNYLTSSLRKAWRYARLRVGDVWAVDTAGLRLRPDPDPYWQGHGWYATRPVCARRLRLRGAAA